MHLTPGNKFKAALSTEKPLQIIGVINAYIALMAKRVGYKALYLSGAGIANSCYGLPDLAVTSLENVLEETRRITDAVDLPLLVDIDTGWGSALMISKTIKSMIKAGAAAIQIEDQVFQKRCGHLEGKQLVSVEEMCDRIKAAVDARTEPSFIILARTDAASTEGVQAAIDRSNAYVQAGADMIFPEALPLITDFALFKKQVEVPLLANLTEFGKTPLLSLNELASVDVDMALYPLSVNRVMNAAALHALKTIRQDGSQEKLLQKMQTRQELYDFLNYDPNEHN